MSYEIIFSNKAKKDLKYYRKNNSKLVTLGKIIDMLAQGGHTILPENTRPHKLSGNYAGYWECHVLPDLLLIWEQTENPKEIYLLRIGSHSELF